jgi:PAS domain S-box-containing protein
MDSTRFGDDAKSRTRGFSVVDDGPPSCVEATTRYRILEELGRGGMGVVYRGHDLALNRDVAVKILLEKFADNSLAEHSFAREAKIMGALEHPSIAKVYEFGTTQDGRPFHTMKLVAGETLGCLMAKRQVGEANLKINARCISIFASVAQAMAYTHGQKFIHLDLKPDNIMYGAFGEVFLMDWGLAKFLHSESGFNNADNLSKKSLPTIPSQVCGTLKYMSPEQANGGSVDTRTDVFCLGAILCEILTGQPAYHSEDKTEALIQAKKAQLGPAYDLLEKCSGEPRLVRLAIQCLQADPDDRPQDAPAIANEFAVYRESNLERLQHDMTRFFEISLDLFCIAGFDGYFRRLNSNFSRVLGYSDNELLAKPFLDFVHEDDREATIAVVGQLSEGKPIVRFRNRYRAKSGELIQFEWTAKSIHAECLIFAVARQVGEVNW